MSDMAAAKQLTGDIQLPTMPHSEIPLGSTTSDNNSNQKSANFLSWATDFKKLNVVELYSRQNQNLRPWTEFFSTNQFKAPANPRAGIRRVFLNVEHFQSNYAVICLILSIYCVITTPSLLFVLLAMFAALYLVSIKYRENQISILGRSISLTHQYIAVCCLCIPLLFFVGAGSAMFWALGASVFVIFLHALFHQVPNQEAFGVQMEEV